MVSLENVFAGDWRAGAAAAEPSDGAGVHGSEAGAGHQAVPPHREGQAGILSTVCYVVDGQFLWDMAASCFAYSFWENMEDVQFWLVFLEEEKTVFKNLFTQMWICGWWSNISWASGTKEPRKNKNILWAHWVKAQRKNGRRVDAQRFSNMSMNSAPFDVLIQPIRVS